MGTAPARRRGRASQAGHVVAVREQVGDDVLSGEAWEQGPVVLAWSEIEQSGRGEGYNVVVHEFVHKLDMLGGEADGVPPLPSRDPQGGPRTSG